MEKDGKEGAGIGRECGGGKCGKGECREKNEESGGLEDSEG